MDIFINKWESNILGGLWGVEKKQTIIIAQADTEIHGKEYIFDHEIF